jgi:hypothetical protein
MTGWQPPGIGGLARQHRHQVDVPAAAGGLFAYLRIRRLVLPSNEHAIQHDPNEVIIGM